LGNIFGYLPASPVRVEWLNLEGIGDKKKTFWGIFLQTHLVTLNAGRTL
jgi:hypothetical protein